ncbi:MAG: hypothetical protein GY870_17235 [archaeon]|nr:hypothetical protein [archaeon]
MGANSYTNIGQELKGDLIHVGRPVNKEFLVQSVEESQEKAERIKTLVDRKYEGGDD